jgi:hypothetical protein
MWLIGMSVVCAGTREKSCAVWTFRLLVLIGVDEGAVQLDSLNTWEVTPAFRTTVPVLHQVIPKKLELKL